MNAHALVADGDQIHARLAAEVLGASGFEVTVVSDGAAALAAIDRHRPDVVVLDARVPGGDGVAVLDHLKADPERAAVPVIVVTAVAGGDELLAAYALGADYLLVKPYTRRQLLHGLGLVLGRDFGG